MKSAKFIICSLINFWLCFYPSLNNDFLTLSIYFLILSLTSYNIIFNKRTISLDVIFLLFIYFFFGIAPIIQYKESTLFFYDKTPLISSDFLMGGVLTLSIMFVYALTYWFFSKKTSINFKYPKYDFEFRSGRLLVIILLICSATMLLNYNNYQAIFFRYKAGGENDFFQSLISILDTVVSFIPLLILIYFKSTNKLSFKNELLLLLTTVILNFPTAVSRYEIGLVYFTLALMYLNPMKTYFKESFIFGLLFLFPLFNHFRYKNSDWFKDFNPFIQFQELHFDSFQNTIGIIKLEIISYGSQLLASFFFFIPRILWESKPKSSASLLCEKIDYNGYCNIAVSYFGEGFINFGFLGVFFFTIILAIYNSKLDNIYHNNKQFEYSNFYLLFIFHEFYLLRGSLTSAVIKFSTIIFSIIIFLFLKKLLCVVKNSKKTC